MEVRTVGDLIADLKKFDPSLKLCHSSDPEGNNFYEVFYQPDQGELKDNEFDSKEKGKWLCIN